MTVWDRVFDPVRRPTGRTRLEWKLPPVIRGEGDKDWPVVFQEVGETAAIFVSGLHNEDGMKSSGRGEIFVKWTLEGM